MDLRLDNHHRLATRLQATRQSKRLSLDAVARLSGVSRSMVSQIERAQSSLTVATLWSLTQALQVDFAGLPEGKATRGTEGIRAEAAPTIDGRGDGVRIFSPAATVGAHEVYDPEIAAADVLVSAAQRLWCREHLSVIEGRVTSDAAESDLGPGDTALTGRAKSAPGVARRGRCWSCRPVDRCVRRWAGASGGDIWEKKTWAAHFPC